MKLKTGKFRKLVSSCLSDRLKLVETQKILESVQSGNKFKKTEPMKLNKSQTSQEQYRDIEQNIERLARDFPEFQSSGKELLLLLASLGQLRSSATELLAVHRAMLDILIPPEELSDDTTSSRVAITANSDYVFVVFMSYESSFKPEMDQCSFSQNIRSLLEILRNQKRKPTQDEWSTIQLNDALMYNYIPVESPSRSLSIPGFGAYQTQPSITDPGQGHINGTCLDLSRMCGIIVHIEHLERERDDRGIVEPYRMASIAAVAMVLSRVGDAAPCTVYIGRPVFEGDDFKTGLLKAVRTIASACSAVFMQGVAECKIAMEGMTATQIIEFMQCIRGEVRCDVYNQILSAAFNSNTPILDDRPETQKRQGSIWITEKFEIAQLAVALCKAGGFEKVTLDGSSNIYPSHCVLEQLSFREAATFVHLAHEQGLLTYFSAGFKFHHLPQAVNTGVDGVGVGGAQILRLIDESTGFHGPFQPENIERILQIRDEAACDWRGQAAALLARLDRLFFEGCITAQDNALRLELFEAICQQDKASCTELLVRLSHIRDLLPDQEHFLIAWAKRLLNAEDPLLAATKSAKDWATFIEVLQRGVKTHDLDLLVQQLGVG